MVVGRGSPTVVAYQLEMLLTAPKRVDDDDDDGKTAKRRRNVVTRASVSPARLGRLKYRFTPSAAWTSHGPRTTNMTGTESYSLPGPWIAAREPFR